MAEKCFYEECDNMIDPDRPIVDQYGRHYCCSGCRDMTAVEYSEAKLKAMMHENGIERLISGNFIIERNE
ncbi:hypothetical protein HYT56_02710 [Candidatus Woesearchaeota archaeon]|nr:hypothetical protein [Candidatus Woesearchaeota archaeon]